MRRGVLAIRIASLLQAALVVMSAASGCTAPASRRISRAPLTAVHTTASAQLSPSVTPRVVAHLTAGVTRF
ncbi:MAG: hypothetical protein ACR2PL_07715 [Dehalococcoidia bacterium]